MPPKVLLNAMHTVTGGGLTYLQGILPHLAADNRFTWVLLAPAATLAKLDIPAGVETQEAPTLGFWKGHWWEQMTLPGLARQWGVRAMVCNANYVPLLAARPIPILHTTPRAAGQAQTRRMKIYWAVLKALTRLSLYRAPAALSVAQHVIADYAGPRTARKVQVAPPAVTLPAPVATPRDPNLVLTVGDFYPQKDYPTLLRAFKILLGQRPQTRLLLVGRAVDPRVTQEVKQLLGELGLSRAVTLAGAVPHARLLQALQQASAYISTSTAECFNLPVLEAMACGVPCVLPDTDFQREVADKAGVYVPTGKGGDIPAAFAVALFAVLETPSIHDMFANAGLARATQFGWDKTAAHIGNVLARVLKIG